MVDTPRSKHTEQLYCVLCLMSILSIQEINASHASMVQILCYAILILLIQTCTHISIHNFVNIHGFATRKRFWTAENQGFSTIPNIHACRYCRHMHKISNAFNAMDIDTVDTNKKKDFFIMSTHSGSNYTVYHSSKSLDYMKIRIKVLY